MSNSTFAARKLVGTHAELALRDLLTNAGAVTICNQINRDSTHDTDGAAVAYCADRTHHLPDLSVYWPLRTVLRRHGVEVKAKRPLTKGGWGWDRHALDRAHRWSLLTGDPVLYCVRDLDAAPLPPLGELDDAAHWHVASVWKLARSADQTSDERFVYWPASEFVPLVVLLEGGLSQAVVPFLDIGPDLPLLLV